MRVSVVTVSLNQGQFLEDTIRSVLGQDDVELEYVVVDGGSTDDSLGIIRRYEERLAYWVSEPDRGQVHALNKGLRQTTGEIFGFLNSDDILLPGALSAVSAYFEEHAGTDWLCGDTVQFGQGHRTQLVRAEVPRSPTDALCWRYSAPQPGMFWRRELVERGFDERWSYDFDHELYLRLLVQGHRCHHLPVPLAAYRLHSTSKTVAEGDRQEEEFDRIAEAYEPLVSAGVRRHSRAVRFIREGYRRTERGDRGGAVAVLAAAVAAYPGVVVSRPFLGTLRRVVSKRADKERTAGR